MNRRESKSAILFRHWLRANPLYTCSIEMKDAGSSNSLPFNAVTESQRNYALGITRGKVGIFMRIEAVSEGMPDYIYMKHEPAYICVKYRSCFTLIDIETFILEDKRSKRRSLTEARAKEIAQKVINTKGA